MPRRTAGPINPGRVNVGFSAGLEGQTVGKYANSLERRVSLLDDVWTDVLTVEDVPVTAGSTVILDASIQLESLESGFEATIESASRIVVGKNEPIINYGSPPLDYIQTSETTGHEPVLLRGVHRPTEDASLDYRVQVARAGPAFFFVTRSFRTAGGLSRFSGIIQSTNTSAGVEFAERFITRATLASGVDTNYFQQWVAIPTGFSVLGATSDGVSFWVLHSESWRHESVDGMRIDTPANAKSAGYASAVFLQEFVANPASPTAYIRRARTNIADALGITSASYWGVAHGLQNRLYIGVQTGNDGFAYVIDKRFSTEAALESFNLAALPNANYRRMGLLATSTHLYVLLQAPSTGATSTVPNSVAQAYTLTDNSRDSARDIDLGNTFNILGGDVVEGRLVVMFDDTTSSPRTRPMRFYDLQTRLEIQDDRLSVAQLTASVGAFASTYHYASASIGTNMVVEVIGGSGAVVPTVGPLTSSGIQNTQATVSWPALSGVAGYEYRYRESGVQAWSAWTANSTTSVTIQQLEPGRVYDVQVRALNADGSSGAPADISILTTGTALALPGQIGPPTASSIGLTSASVGWSAPTRGGAVESYEYRTRDFYGNWDTWVNIGSATSLDIGNLESGAIYVVRVRARNSRGFGPSRQVSFTTRQAIPSAPVGVDTDVVTSTTAEISWNFPGGLRIDYFSVRIREEGGSWSEYTLVRNGATSHTFTGLTASTTYEFEVSSGNSAGSSPVSSGSFTTAAA